MALRLQITYDEGAQHPRISVSGFMQAGDNAPVARVGFDLSPTAVSLLKRRERESEGDYNARVAKTLPSQIQIPPEHFDKFATICKELITQVSPLVNHYGSRAALEHALLAEDKLPAGVNHRLRIGGSVAPKGQSTAAPQKRTK